MDKMIWYLPILRTMGPRVFTLTRPPTIPLSAFAVHLIRSACERTSAASLSIASLVKSFGSSRLNCCCCCCCMG